MIKELYIENLAVIEKAVIELKQGFNVFTGETGAGKSILIGGINAISGGRVSKDIVRSGADKAVVTALFDEIPKEAEEKLSGLGYTNEQELLLTREILPDGKSIARINGKTATAGVLREIAACLIDIHGQNDTKILMNCDNQRDILDNFGGIEPLLQEYSVRFKEFSAITKKLKKIQDEERERGERIASLEEKIAELSKFGFQLGEEEKITSELTALRNIEEIAGLFGEVNAAFEGNNDGEVKGAAELLRLAEKNMNKLAKFIPECSSLSARIEAALAELYDIQAEFSALEPDLSETERLPELQERISEIARIKRRYNMELDEIVTSFELRQNELSELQAMESGTENLSEQRTALGNIVKTLATEISDKRKSAALVLAEKIGAELAYLDMPDVKLLFDIRQDKVTVKGMDTVEILISANKGEIPKPMSKTASGGELSRIMLAVKAVIADCDNVPTMIFDEIDTGISGRAANKAGVKMSEIAKKRQVICVTHLAQIAAKADRHLLIQKISGAERTFTQVTPLDRQGRERELARIISGEPDSETALESARELINN